MVQQVKRLILLAALVTAGCGKSNPAEPSNDRAFEEGRAAASVGLERTLNPYQDTALPSWHSTAATNGHCRARWFAGYNQGLIEAKEKASK